MPDCSYIYVFPEAFFIHRKNVKNLGEINQENIDVVTRDVLTRVL